MTLPTTDEVLRWVGLPVHDDSGTEIGTCQNVYADDDTGVPEWIEVALPDDGAAMVPIPGAAVHGDALRVAHPADRVRQAPRFPADVDLEVDDERALYEHYGVPYSTERSDSLLPAEGRDTAPAPPAAAPRRLRRIEPVPTTPPPPALPAPQPDYAESGSDRRPLLALLAAVPAAALLARWLRQRRQPAPAERGLDIAQRVVPVLAPLAAGLAALVWQRRRTEAAAPLEVDSTRPEVEVAVVAVAETPIAPAPEYEVAEPPVVPVAEVVDRSTHRPT